VTGTESSERSYRSEEVASVAVVGCGLIGALWAAFFLSRGLDVNAADPAPGAEGRLNEVVEAAFADLARLGSGDAGTFGRLRFHADLPSAVSLSDFVQESTSENIDLKRRIVSEIDASAPPDVLIASSTSSLRASEIQRDCAAPRRVLVAHPFNPPHLVPLVELVPGEQTDPAAQQAAHRFFARLGKKPILVRKEVVGHVANRLTAALWREAVHLVAEGIATVADVDDAVRHGPGLRWAIHGPHMLYHLGARGGLADYLAHLGPAQEARWATLGSPTLSEEVKGRLVAGVLEESGGRSVEDLSRERNEQLIAVIQALNAKSEGE
jgi:carnitine 3-dehydrogenase